MIEVAGIVAPVFPLILLGAGAPTRALCGLGASLADFAAQGRVRETGLATMLNLVIQPLLVWSSARLVGLAALPTAVLVITAGVPTGANAFFLARRTQIATAFGAGTVAVATALSLVTLSLLLGWVR